MEFAKEVAEAFPIILDYVYSPDDQLDVTVENIPALMTLADYLDIQSVRDNIAAYCLKNLNIETCALFHGYGKDYNMLQLQNEALKVCCDHLPEICLDSSSMAKESRLSFWLDMQQHINGKDEEYLMHFSRHVAAFCFCRKEQLTVDEFEMLTSAESLPYIHFKAAEQLIQVEMEIVKPMASELTNLQVHCINALASAWKIYTCPMDRLLCFSPLMTCTLTKKLSENAKNEFSRLSKTNQVRVWFSPFSVEEHPEVAGVYSLDSRCSYGHHCFCREGQWKEKQSKFYLFFEENRWHIAVVVQRPELGHHEMVMLYKSIVTNGDNSLYFGKSQPEVTFI